MAVLQSNLNKIVTKIQEANLPEPALIGIDGFLGAGKSRLAAALCTPLEAAYVDARLYMKPQAHAADLDDLYDWKKMDRELFSPFCSKSPIRLNSIEDGEKVIKIVHCRPVLIIDGPFLNHPDTRSKFHYWIFVDVPFEERKDRFLKDHKSLDEFEYFYR